MWEVGTKWDPPPLARPPVRIKLGRVVIGATRIKSKIRSSTQPVQHVPAMHVITLTHVCSHSNRRSARSGFTAASPVRCRSTTPCSLAYKASRRRLSRLAGYKMIRSNITRGSGEHLQRLPCAQHRCDSTMCMSKLAMVTPCLASQITYAVAYPFYSFVTTFKSTGTCTSKFQVSFMEGPACLHAINA